MKLFGLYIYRQDYRDQLVKEEALHDKLKVSTSIKISNNEATIKSLIGRIGGLQQQLEQAQKNDMPRDPKTGRFTKKK